jgi:NADH:ubiquinone oxidoreductase subunit 6 (subunit J)
MLTQSKSGPARLVFHHQAWAAAIATVILLVLLVSSVLFTTWPLAVPGPIAQTARDVATLIFTEQVFAFEVVSLLLLAAVVGGIYLARREGEPEETPERASAEPPVATGARGAVTGMAEKP